DQWHFSGLLRSCRKGPNCRRTPQCDNEFSPPHGIYSRGRDTLSSTSLPRPVLVNSGFWNGPDADRMSALGQKQTFALHQPMSALPPRADMCGATRDVRFGPKADVGLRLQRHRSGTPCRHWSHHLIVFSAPNTELENGGP